MLIDLKNYFTARLNTKVATKRSLHIPVPPHIRDIAALPY